MTEVTPAPIALTHDLERPVQIMATGIFRGTPLLPMQLTRSEPTSLKKPSAMATMTERRQCSL